MRQQKEHTKIQSKTNELFFCLCFLLYFCLFVFCGVGDFFFTEKHKTNKKRKTTKKKTQKITQTTTKKHKHRNKNNYETENK